MGKLSGPSSWKGPCSKSDWQLLASGIPQDSLLRPILFKVFITNLGSATKCSPSASSLITGHWEKPLILSMAGLLCRGVCWVGEASLKCWHESQVHGADYPQKQLGLHWLCGEDWQRRALEKGGEHQVRCESAVGVRVYCTALAKPCPALISLLITWEGTSGILCPVLSPP